MKVMLIISAGDVISTPSSNLFTTEKIILKKSRGGHILRKLRAH
jgi:hypothetical protein